MDTERSRGEDAHDDETVAQTAQEGMLELGGLVVGERIGPYRLVEKLGEGGMGVVFLAEQDVPLRRRVAIKIIKRGMDTAQVVARFESERQALALMSHPNIARVYDAGSTPDGRPYFVMEYIDGEPITTYCDRYRLSTRDRLELLRQVCDGVQHAHQKAIIHRDIKPSNVIVTVHDERVVPKIIDFGIAKAIEHSLTERTLFTEHGQLVGTPEYMSPEQAGATADAVDTRTDVYSLGVMLYELLVGVLPFDPTELRRAGFNEIIRRIREDEPHRPSTRLSTIDDTTSRVAQLRRTNATRLTGQLRGDLDWITMKALDKDPSRRYPSPSELAADLGRYLRNEPVLAGPPTPAYRLRKFARRHMVGVTIAASALAVLIAFAVLMTVQAGRIARERDRANAAAERATREAETSRQVTDFLVGLFESSDPGEARGESITARELLDRGAERIEGLSDQPVTQASFMEAIGGVYLVLSMYDEAAPLLEHAVEVRETRAGEDELALAASLHLLANLYDSSGDAVRAEPVARRVVEIRERHLGESEPLANGLNTLGNTLWHQERLDEAETVHRRALAIREAALGPEDPALSQSLHNIGALRYFQSDLAGAERFWRRAMELEKIEGTDDNYNLATTMHTLAIVCQDQERFDEALELELESLAIRERVLGPEHVHVALSLTTLGNIYRGMERPGDAEPVIRRAVEIAEGRWGPEHGEVWWMRRSLARTLIALERYDDAERVLLDLIATIEKAGQEGSLTLNLNTLGSMYLAQRRLDEAEATYDRSLDVTERNAGPDDPDVGLCLAGRANVYREQRRFAEAEADYRRAIDVMERTWGANDPDRLRAVRDYAAMLRLDGRDDEAAALETEASSLEPQAHGPNP